MDPVVRQAQSGQLVTNFSLATSRRWKDSGGNLREQTEWHSVVCFGRLAEVAGQYLSRSRQVYVEGRLQTRSWADAQTGQRRYRTEVICENFQMLGQRAEPEAAAPDDEEAPDPAPAAQPAQKKTVRRKRTKKS